MNIKFTQHALPKKQTNLKLKYIYIYILQLMLYAFAFESLNIANKRESRDRGECLYTKPTLFDNLIFLGAPVFSHRGRLVGGVVIGGMSCKTREEIKSVGCRAYCKNEKPSDQKLVCFVRPVVVVVRATHFLYIYIYISRTNPHPDDARSFQSSFLRRTYFLIRPSRVCRRPRHASRQ